MKLVPYKLFSNKEEIPVTRLAGVKKGKIVLYAFRGKDSAWRVKARTDSEGESENRRLYTKVVFSSLFEVLLYFNQKSLTPYAVVDRPARKNQTPSNHEKQERRRFFRKQVRLTGEYVNSRNGERNRLTVADLSFGGLKFIPSSLHGTLENDTLWVSFHLDDPKESRVVRNVKPVRIDRKSIAGEFVNTPLYDPDLGFYLR